MSTLATPPLFRLAKQDGNHLTLESDGPAVAHVFVLDDDIIRVMVLPDGALKEPRSWAIAPGLEDVPTDGRDRFDLSGFKLPAFDLREEDGKLVIQASRLRLTIRLNGFFCAWETSLDTGLTWHRVLRDRPTQAYNFGWWDEKVHHYLVRDPQEKYFGLGERSGELDRAGRRFRMSNVDAMGYDARNSDPLYKHIPFYVTRTAAGAAVGIFYDTLSDCTFGMGCERSNYHSLFRGFVADHGDLDYYVIASGDAVDITRRYTWLTGKPAFLPKWALGYSGSTMSYTDQPDAQARMADFLAKCEEHDILCDSFHLSSGYTSIDDKRYVFHWNRDKFPDPAAFVQSYADKGVRLIPNIKPALLRDHPLFAEAQSGGLLICDESGAPDWVQFWGAVGAYLDFTNPATLDWWKEKVTTALLDVGMAGTWNDNNEFEIVNPKARGAGFGAPHAAIEAKPLHTLQMLRASREAQIAKAPDKRPYLVSRAGFAGMQRYVQTWSGDNYTSWETLKYNVRMGLGLALSGVSNNGHDIGGFDGPRPDAELFVRWVGFGIFMPRFSIHSWNTDGTANEPWMHPQVTPHIRDLIKFRYRLLPYLYDLSWKYTQHYDPIIRPTFFDFPNDPQCFEECDDMMLGAALLVAPVVEPGVASREVYLPGGTRWFDYWSGEVFEGGQTITRPAPFRRPPLLAREGSIIALNTAEQHFLERADTRGFAVFPLASGTFQAEIFDDDGEQADGGHRLWRVRVTCSETEIEIAADPDAEIILPARETRPVRRV